MPGTFRRGGAAPALLLAAVHERDDPRPLPDVQQPHPLGPVELVGRGAQEIDVELIRRKREMAEGLDGVGMETDAPLAGEPADLGDRLDRPDLVVGVHDGDENGLVR